MARPAWRLDPALRTAERLSDCPLSLNGIAKGYIVERACDAALAEVAGRRGRDAQRRRRPPRPRRDRRDDRDRRPVGRFGVVRAARATSRSRTDRSPPAATRSAGSGSTASGTLTSSIPGSGLPVERVVAATVVAERSPTPTPSPRSATCSSRRRACGWRSRCPGVECLIVDEGRADDAERRLAPLRAAAARLAGLRRRAQRPGSQDAGPTTGRTKPSRRRPTGTALEHGLRAARQLRDQPPRGRGRPLSAAVRGRLGRGQGRELGPDAVALGLDGRRRAVPVAPRPEALVCRRRGAQAPRQEGPVLHDRPADPAARQVQGDLGRQGQPRQAARRPASTRSPSRPPASTGRIRASARR